MLTCDVYENPAVQKFGGKYVSLQQLLREPDIVSLHVPLTPETYYMINAETLAIMKPGAMLTFPNVIVTGHQTYFYQRSNSSNRLKLRFRISWILSMQSPIKIYCQPVR